MSTQVQDFYNALHRGGTHAYAQQIGQYTTTYWWRVGEPMRLPMQEKNGAIYVCVSPLTMRVTPEDRKRYPGKNDRYIEKRVAGKDRTIECVNALYREYDGKNFTHPTPAEVEVQYQILKADPANARTPEKGLRNQAHGIAEEVKFKTDPQHYLALALQQVCSLSPQPSVVVYSGGGYNCYWLLDKTFYIASEEDRKRIQDIQKRWVALDPAADQGVNDLRRIFRPVGSMNYKELYAPNYPTVSFIKCELSLTFDLKSLVAMLPAVAVVTTPTRQPSHNQARATATPYAGLSVIDPFNAAHSIVDLMAKYGYTQAYGDKWSRPGTKDRCVTVFTATNTMLTRSWNDPAYNNHKATDCFNLYKAWEHDGDMKAAIEGARALLGMEKKHPNPTRHCSSGRTLSSVGS